MLANTVDLQFPMLRSALVLLTITIIAAVFGYSDVSHGVAYVARIIFFVSLILFMLVLVIDHSTIKKDLTKKTST